MRCERAAALALLALVLLSLAWLVSPVQAETTPGARPATPGCSFPSKACSSYSHSTNTLAVNSDAGIGGNLEVRRAISAGSLTVAGDAGFAGNVSVTGTLSAPTIAGKATLDVGSTGTFEGFGSTDGGNIVGHLTINSGLTWLPDAGVWIEGKQGTLRRSISRIHLDRSAWTDADGDQTITLGSVPAGTAVVGVNAVIRTGYWCSGGNPTTSNLLIGTGASPTEFLAGFQAKSAAGTVFGDTNAEAGACCTNTTVPTYGKVQSYTADTNITARLTTAGCNVNALTDGGIDLYFVTEQYAQ